MSESLQTLDQVKATAIDMGVKFGPRLLIAGIILLVGYMAGRWAGVMVTRLLARFKLEAPVRQLIARLVQLFVLCLFVIMAMQNLGVELLPLVAGLGVAGAGIALALQGVLGNIVAGLTIIFTQPFHVGDYISIGDEEGEVLDISLFSTTLGHTDRSRVVIPSRKIVGEILYNCGQVRRLTLTANVAYGTDVATALGLVNEVLAGNPRILKTPVPVVGVARLADSSVSLNINPWVNVPDYEAAISEVNQAVLAAFRVHGIVIALPQREVRMV